MIANSRKSVIIPEVPRETVEFFNTAGTANQLIRAVGEDDFPLEMADKDLRFQFFAAVRRLDQAELPVNLIGHPQPQPGGQVRGQDAGKVVTPVVQDDVSYLVQDVMDFVDFMGRLIVKHVIGGVRADPKSVQLTVKGVRPKDDVSRPDVYQVVNKTR
jgi:hypothetical protein